MMHRSPKLTADAVVLRDNLILLVKRVNNPFKGLWALPGGFVEYGETVEDAVLREVREETGVEVEIIKLVGVYSKPDRDPRGHTVTVAFLCRPKGSVVKAGSDASEASYHPLDCLPVLAFDHARIVEDAVKAASSD